MSEEQNSKFLTALFSIMPVVLLLGIDIYTMFLQTEAKAISHFNLGVLAAQFICSLVFLKGRICNGQRGRLTQAVMYFAVYWLVWLLLSLFSSYHFILTDMLSVAGLLMLFSMWRQPLEPGSRRLMLNMGALAGLLGVICFFVQLAEIPVLHWVQYNFFGQTLAGVILANLLLEISRNRLQSFIALLPLVMSVLLVLNSILTLAVLAYGQLGSAVVFANNFAFVLYFLLHLVMIAILAFHIFRKAKLSYNTLMLLLVISLSLPLWASFAYLE
ncbi:hypothetical protein [Basfia succiniciproducens]|uniref:hypothetical protein n=1 Tax=Basfia succiniciproducens TaxID=653940 RepID=UPI0008C4786B|nr:hypothetical protein [Basfia succiniciproducens]SEQ79336.1 hypothetical protein SAMN02910415_02060 [Basfia succiniciproducens]